MSIKDDLIYEDLLVSTIAAYIASHIKEDEDCYHNHAYESLIMLSAYIDKYVEEQRKEAIESFKEDELSKDMYGNSH